MIGRSTVDTLSFSIDDTGLFATVKINARDADAVSLYARTQRGDVDQASFGFDEEEVTYTDLPGGRIRRTINKISKLWEISVCTFREQRREAQKNRLKRRFKHHA